MNADAQRAYSSADLMLLLDIDERAIPDASRHDSRLLETLRQPPEVRPFIQKQTIVRSKPAPYDWNTTGLTIAATPEVQWFVYGDQLKKHGVTLAISLALIVFFGQSWLGLLGGVLGLYNLVVRLSPDEAELMNRIADWTIAGRKYDYGVSEKKVRDSYEEDVAKVDALIRSLLDRKILARVGDRLRIVW
jgi:hypothetical protein